MLIGLGGWVGVDELRVKSRMPEGACVARAHELIMGTFSSLTLKP